MLHVLAGLTLLPQIRPGAPAQPRTGPGGRQYGHGDVVARARQGRVDYWIFEPAGPTAQQAPVVLFVPGWGGVHPAPYRAWIDHLVRRGNIVVYPIYQRSILELPWRFTSNAIVAVHDAMEELRRRTSADWDRLAVVGHSAGAVVGANLAAEWKRIGLPKPGALMAVQPGGASFGRIGIPLWKMSRIPSSTLMLTIAGDDDAVVGKHDAIRIYREATGVPAQNRNFVLFRTDSHGWPWVHSGHFSPCSLGDGAHAVDWYGYWKLLDGLCDAAFFGRNRKYALGDTPQQRFMGRWSDGTPVRELEVVDDPKRFD